VPVRVCASLLTTGGACDRSDWRTPGWTWGDVKARLFGRRCTVAISCVRPDRACRPQGRPVSRPRPSCSTSAAAAPTLKRPRSRNGLCSCRARGARTAWRSRRAIRRWKQPRLHQAQAPELRSPAWPQPATTHCSTSRHHAQERATISLQLFECSACHGVLADRRIACAR